MNKVTRSDGFPVMQFQVLPDYTIKILHSICQKIWKARHWPQNWKKLSLNSNPKERLCQIMFKECSNYHTIACISHASKVMLKVLQARLQQYMNWEFSAVKSEFRKVRGTRDQIANIHWIREKAREFKIYIYIWFGLCQRFFLCGWQQTMENSWKDSNNRSL